MAWYYKEGEKEIGPVNKTQLQELIKAKKVNANTLIRGMDSNQWRPLAEMVRPKKKVDIGSAKTVAVDPPTRSTESTPAAAPQTSVCSQCGRSFPEDQVIHYDNQVICGACKPTFVQKLKEGVDIAGAFRYAGFWIRVAAAIIDYIILLILQIVIITPISKTFFPTINLQSDQPPDIAAFFGVIGMQTLIGMLIPLIYYTLFVGRFGATPGKMACRLKIVTPTGGRISYLRAFARYWATIISSIILCIGYLMVAFDKQKRGLHDRICSTRVIRK